MLICRKIFRELWCQNPRCVHALMCVCVCFCVCWDTVHRLLFACRLLKPFSPQPSLLYDNHICALQIEEREDHDLGFLKSTAGNRARLFAERYESAVFGLEWPVSGVGAGFGRDPNGTRMSTRDGAAVESAATPVAIDAVG